MPYAQTISFDVSTYHLIYAQFIYKRYSPKYIDVQPSTSTDDYGIKPTSVYLQPCRKVTCELLKVCTISENMRNQTNS